MDDFRSYRSPFDDLVGTKIVESSADRVVATVDVDQRLQQPNGIVHGGVYATIVETTASIGANLWLGDDGVAVGVANHTDFLGSISEGTVTADARPLRRGRSLQLWRVDVSDQRGELVAHGTVRLMNLRG